MNDNDQDFPEGNLDERAPEVAPELSRVINLDQLKGDRYEMVIEANAEERSALAARFDLIELKKLTASLIFMSTSDKSHIHVTGHLEATLTQRCVVTLVPVPDQVSGNFECDYAQAISSEDIDIVEFDGDTEDPPEAIIDNEFDIGIMLAEQFGIDLEPFPRAPGADFNDIKKDMGDKLDSEEVDNPFAVLKKLK